MAAKNMGSRSSGMLFMMASSSGGRSARDPACRRIHQALYDFWGHTTFGQEGRQAGGLTSAGSN